MVSLRKLTRDSHEHLGRAVLFVIPLLAITAISMLLFSLLTGFTTEQYNDFSIIVMAALFFSLLGSAGIQVVIYRVMDDRENFREAAPLRAVRLGALYSLVPSIFLAGVMSVYFVYGLLLPLDYVLHFVTLILMYSLIWILLSGFWAADEFRYPPLVFVSGYLVVSALTYLAHRVDPGLTISGYTAGVAVLLIMAWVTTSRVFRYPLGIPRLREDAAPARQLATHNKASIVFNILYVLAIFLDKVIVWITEGVASGAGIMLIGTYTNGSFLGLTPLLGIAGIAYFSSRTRLLVDNRYEGTLSHIERRAREYRRLYWKNLRSMLAFSFGILVFTAFFARVFIFDETVVKVLLTTGIGALFLLVIVYNSAVLPLFGKSVNSMLAILAVCLGEAAAIPFVTTDTWFAALGFLAGGFAGALISFIPTARQLSNFEYSIFRFLGSSVNRK